MGFILNVTREIDNFFPGLFSYHNVRVYDEDATDLLAHWNDTYNFIVKAKWEQNKPVILGVGGGVLLLSRFIKWGESDFSFLLIQ